MKKINKLLSLLLVLVNFTCSFAKCIISRGKSSCRISVSMLISPDYFTIENSGLAAGGGIKDTIDFIEGFNENGSKSTNQQPSRLYPQETAGYQLSWKTTRIIVALDYYNPISGKVERLGYQFRPDELIKANNSRNNHNNCK